MLLDDVRALLAPSRGGVFVDGTLGLGGHARMLLEGGADRLIGIDRDLAALARAAESLAAFGSRVRLVHGDYRTLDAVLDREEVAAVAGVLLDLGVSSMQLDAEGRGFSFRRDEPLDMRMDQTQGPTAADLLARVEEAALADVIYQFGEERKSRRVARAIVQARDRQPIETTGQLAAIVRRAVGGPWHRIDPATRTFQALRIWVNGELEGLDASLRRAVEIGKWADGVALTREQRELCLQAVIAWEARYLENEARTGYIDRGVKSEGERCATHEHDDEPEVIRIVRDSTGLG